MNDSLRALAATWNAEFGPRPVTPDDLTAVAAPFLGDDDVESVEAALHLMRATPDLGYRITRVNGTRPLAYRIVPDRPGYPAQEPDLRRRLLALADELRAIARQL